jgi:hypothetical protein
MMDKDLIESSILREARTETVWEDEASSSRRWRSLRFLVGVMIVGVVVILCGIGLVTVIGYVF